MRARRGIGHRVSPYGNSQLSEPDEVALKPEVALETDEPDECDVFGASPKPRDRPTSDRGRMDDGGIDKLVIYWRIGIDEVWHWDDDHIRVYGLVAGISRAPPARVRPTLCAAWARSSRCPRR
jgi:hypothetical protein